MKGHRAKKDTTLRTETLSIRMDPRLRYLAKVAAQKQRRPISSFVEWAVEQALSLVDLGPSGRTLAETGNFLWDVVESDRLVKLALNFEELLNHEEQLIWKVIRQNKLFWVEVFDTDLRYREATGRWGGSPDGESERVVIPDLEKIRERWALIQSVATGEKPASSLPSPPTHRIDLVLPPALSESRTGWISEESPAPPMSAPSTSLRKGTTPSNRSKQALRKE